MVHVFSIRLLLLLFPPSVGLILVRSKPTSGETGVVVVVEIVEMVGMVNVRMVVMVMKVMEDECAMDEGLVCVRECA